jgi:4'-phosphopantetheinyl transferase
VLNNECRLLAKIVHSMSAFVANDLAAHGYAAAWALDGSGASGAVRVTHLPFPDAAAMPEQDEVLLWIGAAHSEHAVRAIATGVLDSDLVTAIDRLQDARDRAASLAVHASLRIALASALARAPHDVRLERGPFGKPHLCAAAGLHFSLSHARGAIGFALARRPVGFDVERIKVLPDMLAVANIAFAEEMRAALTAVPREAQTALFYRFWTLGEAHIKATGLGISQGLQTFAFAADDPPRLSRATPGWGPPERWRFGLL